jgi:hypothetical protein
MLMLPPGAERNPIAIAVPPVAVGMKVALALVIVGLARRMRYFRGVMAVGVAAWTIGALSNLLVLL